MEEFMTRLKKLRESRGLSQQAVADRFSLSQQSVYKYEHGLSEPDISMLKDMADFFNVSVDYLIGYTDIPVHYEKIDSGAITRSELRVLNYYRRLSPHAQEAIQTLLNEQDK